MRKRPMGWLILVAIAATSAAAVAADAKALYQQAFVREVRSSFAQLLVAKGSVGAPGQPEFERKLDSIVDVVSGCHMRSLEFFSEPIRQQTYAVVAKGGSYADAKQTMNTLLAAEGVAGGAREAAMKKMVVNSVDYGKTCMSAMPAF